MPLGSVAMFVPPPSEWGMQFVNGIPPWNFSKAFRVERAHLSVVLELEVLTSYEHPIQLAVVRVNNTPVGKIEPRLWRDLYDYPQAQSVHFSAGVLTGASPHTGPQTLEIVPVDQFSWLIVTRWRILYNQQTA
jgi:hypothetical protein